ncbi:MAG: 4-hydroxythreonine-4-phosphate dehydrogenase PdxA, partial [Planctomycetales bacterium]|nr:4-hydroxythreonine-4-phosphate dehydrogenase PdxA [Planctomycetales bacterium]
MDQNTSMQTKPRIGLTMGDPAGVGPELVLRALESREIADLCQLVIFGDYAILQACAAQTGLALPEVDLLQASDLARFPKSLCTSAVVNLQAIERSAFEIAQVSGACGQASFAYIQAALDAALAGQIDAITTAPINKEALHAGGIHYPGHTEMFAERAEAARWCMMQYSTEITCSFVTVHCGYAEVPQLLTQQRVLDTIELTHEALWKIRGKAPQIVVCGLNPHAGEHGLFGNREEETIIIPAMQQAKQRGINLAGPLPPDTCFVPWMRKATDVFVCMYHDQGHIP